MEQGNSMKKEQLEGLANAKTVVFHTGNNEFIGPFFTVTPHGVQSEEEANNETSIIGGLSWSAGFKGFSNSDRAALTRLQNMSEISISVWDGDQTVWVIGSFLKVDFRDHESAKFKLCLNELRPIVFIP
jgi:hypothetical protein